MCHMQFVGLSWFVSSGIERVKIHVELEKYVTTLPGHILPS